MLSANCFANDLIINIWVKYAVSKEPVTQLYLRIEGISKKTDDEGLVKGFNLGESKQEFVFITIVKRGYKTISNSFPVPKNKNEFIIVEIEAITKEYISENDDLLKYQSAILEITKRFQDNLKIITDSTTSVFNSNICEQKIFKLFENYLVDTIEVSSLYKKEIKKYSVKDYIGLLKGSKYTKIEISWYNLAKIEKISKINEKSYAEATIYQQFIGYENGVPVYGDKTQKRIEISENKFLIEKGDKVISSSYFLIKQVRVKETLKLK